MSQRLRKMDWLPVDHHRVLTAGILGIVATALLSACGQPGTADPEPVAPQSVIDVSLASVSLQDALDTADTAFVGVVERLGIEQPPRDQDGAGDQEDIEGDVVEGDVVAWLRIRELLRGEVATSSLVPVMVYREVAEGVVLRVGGEVVDRATANAVPQPGDVVVVIGFGDSAGISGIPGAVLPVGEHGIGLVDVDQDNVVFGPDQEAPADEVGLTELRQELSRDPPGEEPPGRNPEPDGSSDGPGG